MADTTTPAVDLTRAHTRGFGGQRCLHQPPTPQALSTRSDKEAPRQEGTA